ncbi:MAG: Na(+)/H(+) antiporter subunit B [Bacillota bacterium]|nr:Na(+)/H(+) antiporter subunit B [Bacillota bacterium]
MNENLIFRTIAKKALFIVIAFSFFLFFAGHNNPGGGFIAGLMTTAALVLVYLAFDAKTLKEALPFDFKTLTAIGLVIGIGYGFIPMLFGDPFLTHYFDYYYLPLLGKTELATATIFDLGVYFTVVGAAMTVILTIGEDR